MPRSTARRKGRRKRKADEEDEVVDEGEEEGEDAESKSKKAAKRPRKAPVSKSIVQRLRASIRRQREYEQTAHLSIDPDLHFKRLYVEMACLLQDKIGGLIARCVLEWDPGVFVPLADIVKGIPNSSEASIRELLLVQCEQLGLLSDESASVFMFDRDVFAQWPKPAPFQARADDILRASARK